MTKEQTAVRQKPAALSINYELTDFAKLHINLVTPDDWSTFYLAYSKEESQIMFGELRKDRDGVPVAPAIGDLTAILKTPGGEGDATEQFSLCDFDSIGLVFLLNGDRVFRFRYEAGDQLSACVIERGEATRAYTVHLN